MKTIAAFLLFWGSGLCAAEFRDYVLKEENYRSECVTEKDVAPVSAETDRIFRDQSSDKTDGIRNRKKLSLTCGERKAALYYFEFGTPADAEKAAEKYLQRIWGREGQSDVHPEQSLLLGGVLVIVSARADDLDFFEEMQMTRVIYSAVPAQVITDLKKRSGCGIQKAAAEAEVCRAFEVLSGAGEAEFPGDLLIGRTWEYGPDGKLQRSFFDIVRFSGEKTGKKSFWSPIDSENPSEIRQLEDIITGRKQGKKTGFPPDLEAALTEFEREGMPMIQRQGQWFMESEGNVALVVRSGRVVALLVSTEQWSGKPGPYLVGIFHLP